MAGKRLDPDANAEALRDVIKECFKKGESVDAALVAGALLEVAAAMREHSSMVFEGHETIGAFVQDIAAKYGVGDHGEGPDDDELENDMPADDDAPKVERKNDVKADNNQAG